VSSAIDLVVQVSRQRDGSRRIIAITELSGMEGDTISLHDLFLWVPTRAQDGRVSGDLRPTGIRPNLLRRLVDMGIPAPAGLAHLFPLSPTRRG